ncbi:MAG: hypothetical protein ACI9MB_002681 [Verrucomicrobiales bacterium]|jgi:bifunctional ADP-heptose synthase (sugar kinase/adenylyltransferase)
MVSGGDNAATLDALSVVQAAHADIETAVATAVSALKIGKIGTKRISQRRLQSGSNFSGGNNHFR